MKTWCYNDPIFDGDTLIGNDVVEVTDDDIIRDYFPFWEKKMLEKYGEGHPFINRNECICDWVVCNWAWEKK